MYPHFKLDTHKACESLWGGELLLALCTDQLASGFPWSWGTPFSLWSLSLATPSTPIIYLGCPASDSSRLWSRGILAGLPHPRFPCRLCFQPLLCSPSVCSNTDGALLSQFCSLMPFIITCRVFPKTFELDHCIFASAHMSSPVSGLFFP